VKILRWPAQDPHASLLVVLLLLSGVVLSISSFDYLPTHDGPQHVYTIHVRNHLDDSSNGYSNWFEPNIPVSAVGFDVLFGPLDAMLGWKSALRIALMAMATLWVVGAYCFAAAIHPGRRWVGVALGAAAFQWSLYMGFFSFYVGSAFGLFVLAFAFGRTSASRPRIGWLAVLLLVQAVLHLMAAVVTGLVLASLLWFRSAPGQRVAQLGRIAAVALPALCVVSITVWISRTDGVGAHAVDSSQTFGPWWIVGKCFMGGPDWRAWPLVALAVSGLLLALSRRGERRSAEDHALWLAGGVLLAAGVLLPLHLRYWEFFSVRFAPLAVCTLAATLPIERLATHSRPIRIAVATALSGFAFASTAWAFSYNAVLVDRARIALSGLDLTIARPGARLPILLDVALDRPHDESQAMMPFVAPLANLGKLYATAQGGFVPEVFAVDPAIHAALLKPSARRLPAANSRYVLSLAVPENSADVALREAVTVYLAANATYYDDIVFLGRPADVELLKWLGFTIDWQNEGLALGRFRGCPLTVRIPVADGAIIDQQQLEIGWVPALGVTHRYPFTRATREADDLVFVLRQTCGEAWLRVANPPDAKTLVCDGAGDDVAAADADGRVGIGVARDHPELNCRMQAKISTAGEAPPWEMTPN